MKGLKWNKTHIVRKGLAGCLLIALLVFLLIFSATARYMTTGRATAIFVPAMQSSTLHLFTRRDADGVGESLQMANSAMQFLCVSNADAEESFVNCENITFRVRLYLQETDEVTQPLPLIMQSGSEAGEWGQEMVAEPRRLDEACALAKVCGGGWIYTFDDAAGQELLFTLSGNEFSDQYFVLRTSGGVFSQFQLKVEIVRMGSEVAQ